MDLILKIGVILRKLITLKNIDILLCAKEEKV